MPKGVRKPVFGVGINDYSGKSSWVVDGVRYKCPIYTKWVSMLCRCYKLGYMEEFPTYKGCSVSEDWVYFSKFRAWMEKQDWEGKQLDKDLLVPGNKVYSAETCVFLPLEINMFMNDHGNGRGSWPLGVTWKQSSNAFVAAISNPLAAQKGSQHIGMFSTAEEAHLAWKKRKHEIACMYADQQTDPRVAEALRTRYL